MSILTENPEVCLSALAACVRRLGGSVVLTDDDGTPFTILSKIEDGNLHITVTDFQPTGTPQ